MTKYDYSRAYEARTLSGDTVVLPDCAGLDQRGWDGVNILVLRDGKQVRARLRGDLYGLWTSGTGDPVVALGWSRA